jgi:hypothetical protein
LLSICCVREEHRGLALSFPDESDDRRRLDAE